MHPKVKLRHGFSCPSNCRWQASACFFPASYIQQSLRCSQMVANCDRNCPLLRRMLIAASAFAIGFSLNAAAQTASSAADSSTDRSELLQLDRLPRLSQYRRAARRLHPSRDPADGPAPVLHRSMAAAAAPPPLIQATKAASATLPSREASVSAPLSATTPASPPPASTMEI